jgi:hypothetical protein
MPQHRLEALHVRAILIGQVQAGFGPLCLFSDFRIRLWLLFSRLARRGYGCELLLGSFPLCFLGLSFFLGGFPTGCTGPGILPPG